MKKRIINIRGSVLIMVLWALSLLAVFAIQISAMTQDKIAFLSRAERYNILRNAAKSGIYKGLAIIKNEPFKNREKNLLARSLTLYFNPSSFRDLPFGQAQTSVFYQSGDSQKNYGVTDESRRLNLNVASRESIRNLLLVTGLATEDEAGTISAGIFDWREFGESEIKGFTSDDFYENLKFPYPPKKDKYETLDELKLVAGMTEKIYERLIDFVTIYGGEEINMNTVSWQVLTALGFTEEQAQMVEAIRRGVDGLEGTLDDFFFQDRNTLREKIVEAFGLKDEDLTEFNTVVDKIPFSSDATIFRVKSQAVFDSRKENTSITCVFDTNDDKIIYWSER